LAIEIISKLKPKGNGKFKIADSTDISFTHTEMEGVDNVEEAIGYLYDVLNAEPKLSYVDQKGFREGDKVDYQLNDQMTLKFLFESSAAGSGTCTITRNGLPYKTLAVDRGEVLVDLGFANQSVEYIYTVTIVDALGRKADQTLTFHHVLGGVNLSSTFEAVLSDKNTVYTANVEQSIQIPFSITYAESGYDRILYYKFLDAEGNDITLSDGFLVDETNGEYNAGNTNATGSINVRVIFPSNGAYTLVLQAGVRVSDTDELYSQELQYHFSVIPQNSINVTMTSSLPAKITTDTVLTVNFRTVTNITALLTGSNNLRAICRIYKQQESSEVIEKNVTIRNITSSQVSEWNVGRISSTGSYRYDIYAEPSAGSSETFTTIHAEGSFEVKEGIALGSKYVDRNLIAYFDANDMSNDSDQPHIWKDTVHKNSDNDYYYFKLHGLNYRQNGWIKDTSDQSMMLKFTGDSYGELRYMSASNIDAAYCPMGIMTAAASGVSIEILFKSRCIGVNNARVMSCRKENEDVYGGVSLSYNQATISSNQQATSVSLAEEQWLHVVFSIDKTIRNLDNNTDGGITNANIEDMNPVKTMRIYINGVLTKVCGLYDTETFTSTTFPALQMILNAHLTSLGTSVEDFGSSEIKMVRLYSDALTSQEVLQNYIYSHFSTEDKLALQNKNNTSKADIPIIYFVRNKEGKRYSADKSFEILHSIKVKKSDDPTVNTSKNSWVNCTMWYQYLDNNGNWVTAHYDDVDVYLQGTSSLQYPVKNYQIKVYNASMDENGQLCHGSKRNFIPPNKNVDDGWIVEDNVYTLKCDYMEQSHKNNTPTACYYEEVLEQVLTDRMTSGGSKDHSPPKRNSISKVNASGETVLIPKYRDAINGFACVVYYNENNVSGTDYNMDENGIYYTKYVTNKNDVYAGSFMFNVDKEGKALGFELDLGKNEDGSKKTEQVTAYVMDEDTGMIKKNEDGSYQTEVMRDKDGNVLTREILPCVSWEGASNGNIGAAAFCTMDHYNTTIYTEYLTARYKNCIQAELISADETYEVFYQKVQNGTYDSLEIIMGKDEDGEDIIEHLVHYEDYIEENGFDDWYDYIEATLEPRYSYADEYEELYNTDDNTEKQMFKTLYNRLSYDPIKNAILWVSNTWDLQETDYTTFASTFRSEFENYFSFDYCLTYYLQMMMFTQVDNAGKNAMFDTWGGKIYPRPYDMDTQMGENNQGQDMVFVGAEINTLLSPTGITGNQANITKVSNSATDKDHKRYITYNTTSSKLWTAFGKVFADEIKTEYANLRNSGIYNVDNICNFIEGKTSDYIGETFYNKDAAAKYLTQTYYSEDEDGKQIIVSEQLEKLQGNRDSRYRHFLTDRMVFLDTFFGYVGNNNLNGSLVLRSDVYSSGYTTAQIGISVYSPQYITIVIGTDVTVTAYVDTDSKYMYNGLQYEGVLFTLPFMANDKDFTISGAGNIKAINHMENLYLKSITLSEAKKITLLSIPNSINLTKIEAGSNTYLRKINLYNSTNLTGSLNLENCINLQDLNISQTGLTSINLPRYGNLKSFVAENCKITSLYLDNLPFLSAINITGCSAITEYKIDGCHTLTKLDCAQFPMLRGLVINNCDLLEEVNISNTNTLVEFEITNCDALHTLKMSGCQGSVFNNLDLTSVYGLTHLDITSVQGSADNREVHISLPLYSLAYKDYTSEEIQAAIAANKDVYWRNLQSLKAASSYLVTVQYGIHNTPTRVCDLSPMTNGLTTFSINSAQLVQYIEGLKYAKSGFSSLFDGCPQLISVTNSTFICTATTESASIDNMFANSNNLTDIITGNTFEGFDKVYYANLLFYNSQKLPYSHMKALIAKIPNVRELASFAIWTCLKTSGYTLEDDFFANNTKIIALQSAFHGANVISVESGVLTPIKDTLINVSAMFRGSKVVTVPNGIIKDCSQLTTTHGMFYECSALKNFLNSSDGFDIFYEGTSENPNKITDTGGMFGKCTELTLPSSGNIKTMMSRLPNVTNISGMFYGCTWLKNIPLGVFENNTKLVYIDTVFANCGSATISDDNKVAIPKSLFWSTEPSTITDGDYTKMTITHPFLQYTRGVFSNVINLTGYIDEKFFYGVPNILSIGKYNAASAIDNNNTGLYTSGFFGNTGILGYHYKMLYPLIKVQDVSMLFFKGSGGGTTTYGYGNPSAWKVSENVSGSTNRHSHSLTLTSVIFGDATSDVKNNSIYAQIFANNKELTNASYAFAGNGNLQQAVDKNGTVISVVASPSMFINCPNISNLNGLFAECRDLTGPLHINLFKGLTRLTTAYACFANCNLTGRLNADLFANCNILGNTSYMFFGNSLLGTDDINTTDKISIPCGLFNSNRSMLYTTAYMFAHCGFTGIFEVGSVNREEVDGNTITTIVKHGLLSECLALTTVEGMFANCHTLKGAIPEDMFYTNSNTSVYTNLTNVSKLFDGCYAMCTQTAGIARAYNSSAIYGDKNGLTELYFIPTGWIAKCVSVTNMSRMFAHVSHFTLLSSNTNANINESNTSNIELLMDSTVFDRLQYIQDASFLFAMCPSFCASLSSNYMRNCIKYLKNAKAMFAYSNLRQIVTDDISNSIFEMPIALQSKNDTLVNMSALLYCANSNNVEGNAPLPSNFSALGIGVTDGTSGDQGMVYYQEDLDNWKDTNGVLNYNTRQYQSLSINMTSWTSSYTFDRVAS
jgi:hypothetical protein